MLAAHDGITKLVGVGAAGGHQTLAHRVRAKHGLFQARRRSTNANLWVRISSGGVVAPT